MTAPAIIQALVNRFRDSRELYRSGRYNEAQLRQEFLNPFFEALGWDMFNRSNFAPQYREVIHEDSLEDEGSLKAPDYAFRIGTTRKFFVEAKKPKVNIRYEIDPAYQLRRYAWNAHLPLSILTDFEELAVYDCRTRPDPKDSAATGRVMLFTFEEYIDRWDELAQIFSKDAVWNGSFDRYAEGTKGKRGTTEVDAEFLKEIEQWRLLLARNIALRNFRPSAGSVIGSEAPSVIANEARQSPSVNPNEARSIIANEATRSVQSKQSPNLHRAERQLNYAVQTTIDRILFLRICEDRQIEPANQLLQIAEAADIYAHLLILFQKADQKYNSGLFHFNKEKGQTSEPDTFTPTLQIDDKVLRQIIKSTYYPCPYMFNEIPVEILGQVYEQFLGSVIRLTPAGQAKVEQKPEVRKAGGVYYTPRYIVDYIVQNTLGRLLGENTMIVPDSRPSTDPDRQVSTPLTNDAAGVKATLNDDSVIVPDSRPSMDPDRQVSTHVNNGAAKNCASLSDEGPSDSALSSSFTPSWEGEQGGGDAAGVWGSLSDEGLIVPVSRPSTDPDRQVSTPLTNDGTGVRTPLSDEGKSNSTLSSSFTPSWEGEQGGGDAAAVRDTSINEDGLESSRSKPVHGQETGTNKVVKPSQRGGSVSEANGGEGNFALESSRSKPVLGQETGTIGKTSTNASLTPTQALNLRVVDPACGSGSFLLGAYQYLLDWHLNYYLTHDPQSHTRGKNPPLVAAEGGEYRLTTETKKRILTSSIHGVDIDSQAVEVTKLSLLLKLLEGETGQLSLGFERVLPDLDKNIRCGNSLIGWDYFKGQMFPDEEEIQRVNPFDWQRAFPHVFAAGGFDAVIGNPPYIRQESLGEDKPYYQNIYEVFTGTADIYSYFIEKGVKLLAPGGQFSYIVANKWLRAKYGFKLRQWLKTKCIEEITDFGDLPVFTGATTYPLILRVSNNPPHFRPRVTTVDTLDFVSLQEYVDEHGEIADQTRFEEDGWSLAGKQTQDLLTKLRQNSIPLGEYVHGKVFYGIKTGLNKAFVIDQATKDRLIAEDPRSAELIKPFAQGRDIKRYAPIPVKQYLILIPKGWTNQHRKGNAWNWFSSQYPAIASHLKQFEKEAIARGDKGDYWWELRACDYYDEFKKPKIVWGNMSTTPNYTMDLNGTYINAPAVIIPIEDYYLLGIMNSSLGYYFISKTAAGRRGGFFEYKPIYVSQMPIHVVNEGNPREHEIKKQIEENVKRILALNKQEAITPSEKNNLEGVANLTEQKIDDLVLELYGVIPGEVSV